MSLAESVRNSKAMLDALRPLSAGTVAALDAWYDVELTYTSNALEGNTLTRSETAIVLEKGITVSGKPLRDHLETTGHRDALLYMRELAGRNEPVRETDVRNLHRLILCGVDPAEAGKYSTHEWTITGSDVILPGPHELPALMEQFISDLNGTPDSPEKAFDAHERLVGIHPFGDGNGRTARLLMNLLLLRAGLSPARYFAGRTPRISRCAGSGSSAKCPRPVSPVPAWKIACEFAANARRAPRELAM